MCGMHLEKGMTDGIRLVYASRGNPRYVCTGATVQLFLQLSPKNRGRSTGPERFSHASQRGTNGVRPLAQALRAWGICLRKRVYNPAKNLKRAEEGRDRGTETTGGNLWWIDRDGSA